MSKVMAVWSASRSVIGLAEEVRRPQLGAAAVPVPPLVEHEPGAVLGVVSLHDAPVIEHHVLDLRPLVQDRVPAPRVEPRSVLGGLAEVGVVVQGEAVHPHAEPAPARKTREEAFGPGQVAVGGVPPRSRGHEERAHVLGDLGDVLAVFGGVLASGHVAAASPGLVSDAPVLDAERLGVAVAGALVGEGERSRGGVAVGHPVVELPRRAGPDVGRHVRLRADQATQAHELVDAEVVRLGGADAPRHARLPEVVGPRTRGGGPDPVAPVVPVGEAAARPAQVRRAEALHVVHELLPDAVDVRDPRVAADPDAVVDHAPEVLDEMAVDVGADDGPRRARGQHDLRVGGEREAGRGERSESGAGGPLQEGASSHGQTSSSPQAPGTGPRRHSPSIRRKTLSFGGWSRSRAGRRDGRTLS